MIRFIRLPKNFELSNSNKQMFDQKKLSWNNSTRNKDLHQAEIFDMYQPCSDQDLMLKHTELRRTGNGLFGWLAEVWIKKK